MKKTQKSRRIKTYVMNSNSMYPLLVREDIILVRKIGSVRSSAIGDCLLYKSARPKPVCHRLVRIKEGILYLKGDCALRMDKPISFAQVLGKVVAIKKQGKMIFLNSFAQGTRARITAYLSLWSLKFNFLMRLMRLLYFSPLQIMKRLSRKFSRCR